MTGRFLRINSSTTHESPSGDSWVPLIGLASDVKHNCYANTNANTFIYIIKMGNKIDRRALIDTGAFANVLGKETH